MIIILNLQPKCFNHKEIYLILQIQHLIEQK